MPHANPSTALDPHLEQDAAGLHHVLLEMKRLYQFRDRERICCHDISITQCWALEALKRCGSLSLNQLAAELYLEKSTASRVVDALERKGYVQRTPHPEDGRALLLVLTPAGADLYGRIEADILAQERAILSEFDCDVREAMIGMIGRLVQAAATRVEAGGGRCCVVDFDQFVPLRKKGREDDREERG